LYLWWRLFYALLESDLALTTARLLSRFLIAVGGRRGRTLVDRLETVAVYSGWPGHQRWWINQHLSRFFSRFRRVTSAGMVSQRRPNGVERPLRVGCIGHFSGLLSFPTGLFEAFPKDWRLHVYDIGYRGRHAPYLAQIAAEYVQVAEHQADDRVALRNTASAINTATLDILVAIGHKADMYELLNGVDTPCVVQPCTGIELVHHPKVSFHICPQLQADYFMKDDRLFCGTTRSPLPSRPVFYGFIPCDARGLPPPPVKAWRERDNLIVFHGSLYKAASPAFLEQIYHLLQDDSKLEFVLIGRDDGKSLALIERLARRSNVDRQVHWEGSYSASRDSLGGIDAPGWQRLIAFMQRARLAPDPWPVIGWSARFEAMMLGAPTVHLALRTDRATWGRRQPVVFDSPQLNVERGTVTDLSEYSARCRQCLYDERFADQLIADQLAVASKSADFVGYWNQLDGLYQRWLSSAA
jgi:hypothetical protein